MPDGHHEVGADEHHDLAGFDDLARRRDGLVRYVDDRAQHQEHDVVVAFEFRALVCMDGILDHQLVESESCCDILHLTFVGSVHAHPDERVVATTNLGQRSAVRVLARQPHAVHVDRAVYDRAGSRNGDLGRIRLRRFAVRPIRQ